MTNTSIENLRLATSRIFIPLLWAHIAVVGMIDFLSPNESPIGNTLPYILAFAFAAVPTVRINPDSCIHLLYSFPVHTACQQ